LYPPHGDGLGGVPASIPRADVSPAALLRHTRAARGAHFVVEKRLPWLLPALLLLA